MDTIETSFSNYLEYLLSNQKLAQKWKGSNRNHHKQTTKLLYTPPRSQDKIIEHEGDKRKEGVAIKINSPPASGRQVLELSLPFPPPLPPPRPLEPSSS